MKNRPEIASSRHTFARSALCVERHRVPPAAQNEANDPHAACARTYHETRDAPLSVTATSRGYVGGAGLGGGRGSGAVRERRQVRKRVFGAIQNKTDDSSNCCRIQGRRLR